MQMQELNAQELAAINGGGLLDNILDTLKGITDNLNISIGIGNGQGGLNINLGDLLHNLL